MIYEKIAEDMKTDILSGACKGNRLPRREELCVRYNATRSTLQNAIDILIEQGLLGTYGRNGTQIRKELARSLTFGIAVQAKNVQEDSLFRMMETAVEALSKSKGFKFKLYYGIMDAPEAGDTKKLLADIDGHVLGGLVLFWPSREMFMRFHRPYLPIICTSEDMQFKNCEYVSFDFKSLVSLLLDKCEESGLKRIALLANTELEAIYIEYFRAEAKRRRFFTREDWIIAGCLCIKARPWIERNVQFMLEHSMDAPPEAIVVLNEQLADSAVKGISNTRLKLNRDIRIFSHCNFFEKPSRAEYVRVGYDIGKLVEEYADTFCRRYETGHPDTNIKLIKALT
ncbi:MAG: GntR family transcriptional regulator [Victivallales bacterium]